MNKETRSQTKNRKRSLQSSNLNTSSEIERKKTKYKYHRSNMATNSDTFRDLSSTITTRSNVNNGNQNAEAQANSSQTSSVNASNVLDPQVRELVVDETLVVQRALEDRMKKMVHEEMEGIRKSVGELTKVVRELSTSRSQTQGSIDTQQATVNNANNANTDNRFNIFPESNRLTFQNPHVAFANGTLFPNSNRNISNPLPLGNLAANPPTGILNTGNFDPLSENRSVPGSRENSENSSRNLEKIYIRVDKWGIVFDGNNTHMGIEDFIFRIEHLQSHYDIPWDEILRDFHLLVTGSARDWYWLRIRTHGVMKWPTLKSELLNQYQTNISNFEIMRDLVERKQQPNETIDYFFQSMCKLRSRLVQPIPEYDMIKIIKRNVREHVARIVYPIAVSSVEQLRIECIEAERNFPRREIRNPMPQQRLMRNISEAYVESKEDDTEMYEEVAAINVKQQKPILICWNCKSQGHGFRDCNSLERTIFCYRCGKPNVIAPRCPECIQGNRTRDVMTTGDMRPAKNHFPENHKLPN